MKLRLSIHYFFFFVAAFFFLRQTIANNGCATRTLFQQ
jgi:hypothetical protein